MSTVMTGGRARVLIADDEPEIRNVLSDLLGESHDCTAVVSAEEALARLSAEEFDLVISDIMMSGMSGLEMVPRALAVAPEDRHRHHGPTLRTSA